MKIVIISLCISILLIVFISSSSSDFHLSKIDSKILSEISTESEKETKVIVLIDETKYKEESASSLGEIEYKYETTPALAMDIDVDNLEALAKKDYVIKIEPVIEMKAFLQNSTSLINATVVWNQQISGINMTGKNIGVCILDSGVNYSHPDLGGCFGSGCRISGGYDYVNDDSDPMDDEGHGTHVAGTVGANGGIKGVAPNSTIIVIKVLNSAGRGTTPKIIAGIDWCVSNALTYNISVITMSLGTDELFSTYCDNESGLSGMRSAINSAIANNISVIAATGNDGSTSGMSAPACLQNVTSVASTTKTDTISSFSNRNNITSFVAPGSSINSTSMSENYVEYSGTSMAAPHVAGSFALLYQKYKLLHGVNPTPDYIRQILNTTAIQINDTSGNKLNFSRINASAASSLINDTQSPLWYNQSQSSNIAESGETLNLSSYWTDNFGLAYSILSTNETGCGNTPCYNKSSLVLSGSSSWSNFSWSNSTISNGTIITWKIYANDTSGNSNLTSSFNFTVVDTKGPMYFDIKNSSDASYSLNKVYQFNITLIDYSNVSHVFLEFNESNSTVSTYREINSTAREYYTNKSGLKVGNYTYKWFTNDTLNNWNITSMKIYNVTKSTPNILLSISPSNSTTYPATTISNGSSSADSGANLTLYRNGTLVNSSVTTFTFENLTLPAGIWNYTLTYNGTENYTFYSIINMTRINSSGTSISLWLNGTENNKTYDRTTMANITALVNSSLNVTIAANYTGLPVDITNNSITATNLTNTSNLQIGLYNITAYYNGYNSNYSTSSKTYFMIVREAYRNNSLNILNSSLTLINASAVNTTLQILTNDTLTNDGLNITVGRDNPTGQYPQAILINKYISIEHGTNITTNLTYAILNITYLDSDLPSNLDESSLRIYRWNSTDWNVSGNGGVDAVNNYVWGNFTALSNFTVAGLLTSGQSCTTNSNCSSNVCCHNICRSACPTCGDGHCDSGEVCSADDLGCSAGYSCSSGCQLVISSGSNVPSGGGGVNKASNTTSKKNVTAPIDEENKTKTEEKVCTVCQNESEWSLCVDKTQTKIIYYCNESSNYTCKSYNQTQKCEIKKTEERNKSHVVLIIIFAISALVATYLLYKKLTMKRKKWKTHYKRVKVLLA